jgi:CRP-like cAMP-binding protein
VDDRIRAVPLFAGLTDEDLDLLGRGAEPIALEAGTELFAEGDEGGHAFVIVSGEIEILKQTGDREVRLAVRGPGEVIGEMACCSGSCSTDGRPPSPSFARRTAWPSWGP